MFSRRWGFVPFVHKNSQVVANSKELSLHRLQCRARLRQRKIAARKINRLILLEQNLKPGPKSIHSGNWPKGRSGNPRGRRPVDPLELEWLKRLRVAAFRKVKIGPDGKALPIERKENEKEIDQLTDAAQAVMDLARQGNAWAIEHLANRFDGKVREQVEVNYSANVKVRYESYQEVRAALLAEGINVDRIPMLTTMRPPEGQERD
jgi:hypothetical protein